MILFRKEVGDMLVFMLAVIPSEEKTGRNCLFVENKEGKLIFTAGSEHCMKRVILLGNPEISEIAGKKTKGKKLPEYFMIPRWALKAFIETLKDHKSICKKLGKEDETRNFVEIDAEELVSIGEYCHFNQPGFKHKELNPFFEQNQESVTDSLVMSGDIIDVMTGFSKADPIKQSYRTMDIDGEIVNLIHYKQESTEYEAVFICPSEPVEGEDKGGQKKF